KRQTDGRNAQEPQGRREQAHRPSVLAEGLSPPLATPYAEASRGRPSALSFFSGRASFEQRLCAQICPRSITGTYFPPFRHPMRAMPEGTVAFDVNAPVEKVWSFLSDMQQVGRCVPGVENVEVLDATHARWTLTVKIGPLSQTIKVLTETLE